MFALAMSSRALRAQDSLAFAGTDRETSEALARIIRAANERGLPIYPIVSKTRLAIVVHAQPSRIVETAQAVADRLDAARAAIATDTRADDIAAGADALSFKIPKPVLTRIHEAAPTQPIAVPIGVLIQLVASQVSPERAGEIVTGLMRRGASAQQLMALGNDVSSDVRRGANAGESADIRLRGLNPLLSPNAASAADAAPTAASSGPKKP